MSLVILITKADALAALPIEIYPEWHALVDAIQDHHIEQASLYTLSKWACTGEDFVTPLLSDDAKKAVSLYAEASRAGNLYESVNATVSAGGGGATTKLTLKAGSLEKTEEFSTDTISSAVDDPLKSADDLFNLIGCTLLIIGNGTLIRV